MEFKNEKQTRNQIKTDLNLKNKDLQKITDFRQRTR